MTSTGPCSTCGAAAHWHSKLTGWRCPTHRPSEAALREAMLAMVRRKLVERKP